MTTRQFLLPLLCLAAPLTSLGCAEPPPPPGAPAGVVVAQLTVTSTNFQQGAALTVDESCDGKDTSPGLVWSTPPQGTKSIAIVLDDLNSVPPEFTHWMVYDLPGTMTKLPEGFEPVGGANADVTGGNASVGLNDFKNARYNGPCPPPQTVHHYRFHVLALDAMTGLPTGADRATLDRAMNGHVLAEGLLKATFAH